jgi:hypothetical protein
MTRKVEMTRRTERTRRIVMTEETEKTRKAEMTGRERTDEY